jgi:acylglycerol lipase
MVERTESESTVQPIETIIDNVTKTEEFVPRNGHDLFVRKWIAPEQKASLILVHGIGEHCSRYDELCMFFAKNGISTISFDQQGFGQSTGPKGVNNVKQMMEDIQFVSDLMDKKGHKHFIMGHSMGGGLALLFASLHPDAIDGVIASAPLVQPGDGSKPTTIEKFLLKILPKYLPTFTLPNVMNLDNLTRDKEEVQKFKDDKLIHDKLCLQLAADLLQMGKDLIETHSHSFQKPVLMTHGTADVLTCPVASKEFYDAIPSQNKQYESLDGYYHELHNEPLEDRQKVYDLYSSWLIQNS